MTTHSKKANDATPRTRPLSTSAGAAMGVGVGAALTAATGDGWWIGVFAGFGALVAVTLASLCHRVSRVAVRCRRIDPI